MPLQRNLGSPRPGIWGVQFMMVTRGGTPIPCNVTRDALNDLFQDKGGIAAMGQLVVFQQCREKIEAIASQKWDCSQLEEDGCVTVRPEDLVKARFARGSSLRYGDVGPSSGGLRCRLALCSNLIVVRQWVLSNDPDCNGGDAWVAQASPSAA